jgi:hypothetical protein
MSLRKNAPSTTTERQPGVIRWEDVPVITIAEQLDADGTMRNRDEVLRERLKRDLPGLAILDTGPLPPFMPKMTPEARETMLDYMMPAIHRLYERFGIVAAEGSPDSRPIEERFVALGDLAARGTITAEELATRRMAIIIETT